MDELPGLRLGCAYEDVPFAAHPLIRSVASLPLEFRRAPLWLAGHPRFLTVERAAHLVSAEISELELCLPKMSAHFCQDPQRSPAQHHVVLAQGFEEIDAERSGLILRKNARVVLGS